LENVKKLEKEINYIKDEKVKEFTIKVLQQVPDYFFEIAASSTGKYHSKFCLGEGGLLRHTKACVTIARDLLGLEMMNSYTQIEKDIIISALILHDTMKHGKTHSQYSVATHPLVIADYIEGEPTLNSILEKDILTILLNGIRKHMGEFCTDYKTKKVILPKPKTKLENFIHLCDYLGSRKYFEEFNFDVNVVRD
jgi:23S rRNA maturation-related 3'-5' exoribonuclease YhaM